MHLPSGRSRAVWTLPIIVVVCALMILPAGAVLGAGSARAPAIAAAVHSGRSSSASPGDHASFPGLRGLSRTDLREPTLSLPTLPSSRSTVSLPTAGHSASPWWTSLSTVSPNSGRVEAREPVSPPNLALGRDRAGSPALNVSPGYQAPPAPMGLADYGVGPSSPYTYNTTSFQANVTFQSPPNATAPSTEGLYEAEANPALGFTDSPYEFSLQLNTIGTNVTIPGADNATLWVQNVIDVDNGSYPGLVSFRVLDDVWNLSANSVFQFSPNAIASGCYGENISQLLEAFGGVYQCSAGEFWIQPSAFPISLLPFTTLSVNSANQDVLSMGVTVYNDAGFLTNTVTDTIVFANPSGAPSPHTPVFSVNGFTRAPYQPAPYPELLQDAEIVFGGPIGGSNSVFTALNGSLQLQYLDGSDAWANIPSGYNFGSDTGETAIGVAGTYATDSGVETIHQGPSYLYGLWNSTAKIQAAPGAILFQGRINESYGFLFVSNVNPGPDETNLSYVPTGLNGGYRTYLPPAIPAGGLPYHTELFAAGDAPNIGGNFSTSQKNFSFPPSFPTPHNLQAPLYMDGDLQAAELDYNLTGRALFSPTPYDFGNLTVNLPLAFTHLNDYAYPSFGIFQAENLEHEVYVNNVSEGSNARGGEVYTYDYAIPPANQSWDYPAPLTTAPWNNYTEMINIFLSTGAWVQNESLYGSFRYGTPGDEGGTVDLFGDEGTYVNNISAGYDSWGVANEQSIGSYLTNLSSYAAANAVTDIGSFETAMKNIAAFGFYFNETTFAEYDSLGVLSESDGFERIANLNATYDAYAFDSGEYSADPAFSLPGSYEETLDGVNATESGVAIAASYLEYSTISDVVTTDYAVPGYLVAAWQVNVSFLSSTTSAGLDIFYSWHTNVTDFYLADNVYDAWWEFDSYTNLTGALFVYAAGAVWALHDNFTSIRDVGDYEAVGEGMIIAFANDTLLYNVAFYDIEPGWTGLLLGFDNVTLFDRVSLNGTGAFAEGIVGIYNYETEFFGLTLNDVAYEAVGLVWLGSLETYFDDTLVFEVHYNATGIVLEEDSNSTFNGTTIQYTHDRGLGLNLTDDYRTVLNGTTVDDVSYGGLGLLLEYSISTWVTDTTIFDLNYTAVGFGAIEDLGVWVADLTTYELSELTAGAVVEQSTLVTLNDTAVFDTEAYATGVAAISVSGLSVRNLFAVFAWNPLLIEGTDGATIANSTIGPSYEGVELYDSPDAVITNTWIDGAYTGVFVDYSPDVSLLNTSIQDSEFGVAVNHSADVSLTETYVNQDSLFGVMVNASNDVTIDGLWVNASNDAGAYLEGSNDATLSGIYANGTVGAAVFNGRGLQADVIEVANWEGDQGYGLLLGRVTDSNVTEVSATAGGIGVWGEYDSDLAISDVYANDAIGAMFNYTNNSVASGISAVDDSLGLVFANDSSGDRVTDVAAVDGSLGVVFFGGRGDSAAGIFASNLSLGAGTEDSFGDAFVSVEATDVSVGVAVLDSEETTIHGIVAFNASLSPIENASLLAHFGLPDAAIVTEGDDVLSVSAVNATNYPVALLDNSSIGLSVSDLNATGGIFALLLNGTEGSTFTGIVADHDDVGIAIGASLLGGLWVYAFDNVITTSRFLHDAGYAVYLGDGAVATTVYDNDFIGNNGATTTYSAAHIQAYSASSYNWFNNTEKIGNYWADWHTYEDGVLAPYPISNGAWDYHPLGAPEGMVSVTFVPAGLPGTTTWSVTFNGVTESSTGGAIVFNEYPGTYAYTVGAVAGWSISPTYGSVSPVSGGLSVTIAFTAEYTVTITETGLPTDTAWSVVFAGSPYTSSGTTLTLSTVAGTFAYSVVAPAGYTASPSIGVLTVTGAAGLSVQFTSTTPPVTLVAVTVEETGLPSGTDWSVTVGSATATGTTASLTVHVPANATYGYAISSSSSTYAASPTSGTITVLGSAYALPVHFHEVVYAVTLSESGLPSGTAWTVTVDGTAYSTTGAALTVELPNGSFTYSFGAVTGYSISSGSGTGTVSGTPTGVSAGYSALATSPSPYVGKSTFNTDLAAAIAIAAVAIVLALVALLRKPKAPTPPPAQPWNETPATTPATGTAPPAGGKPGA